MDNLSFHSDDVGELRFDFFQLDEVDREFRERLRSAMNSEKLGSSAHAFEGEVYIRSFAELIRVEDRAPLPDPRDVVVTRDHSDDSAGVGVGSAPQSTGARPPLALAALKELQRFLGRDWHGSIF
jgi:hypothetical protein